MATAAAGGRWPNDNEISHYSGSGVKMRASAMPNLPEKEKREWRHKRNTIKN